jgi:hypothetical protein
MSVAEMKKIILEKVETLTEQQLIEVSLFADRINKNQPKGFDLMPYIGTIVNERKGVLKKLAQ